MNLCRQSVTNSERERLQNGIFIAVDGQTSKQKREGSWVKKEIAGRVRLVRWSIRQASIQGDGVQDSVAINCSHQSEFGAHFVAFAHQGTIAKRHSCGNR